MRAQLEKDIELLSLILCTLRRIRYAFIKRLYIVKIFFNSLSTYNTKNNIN